MRRSISALLGVISVCAMGCIAEPVGVTDPSIVNGTLGGDPAVVWLFIETGRGGAACTGTLISPRVVLTAKHCVQEPGADGPLDASLVHVGVGDRVGEGTYLQTQSVYATPGVFNLDGRGGLDGSLVGSDIGVIVLRNAASGVHPIPVRRESPNALFGTQITATGFGQTPSGGSGVLYHADAQVMQIDGNLIVVGPLVCQGDSGGPMITADHQVAAVASFITDNCGSGYGAYNAVYNYLDLIDMALEEGGDCQPNGAEVCDGRDNDCNGQVDETCTSLGGACDSDDMCQGTLCREVSGTRICTASCDPLQAALGCPQGLYCARSAAGSCEGFCAPLVGTATLAIEAACTQDSDCASLFCADPGDGRRRCLSACRADGDDCYSGEACAAVADTCGGCVASGLLHGVPRGLGEPCASAGECASNVCFDDVGVQYCSRTCEGGCPNGYHCRDGQCARGEIGGFGNVCIGDADCGHGTICATQGSRHWCTVSCENSGNCQPGFECLAAGNGAARVCAPMRGLLGDACSTGEQCISGVCASNGACVRECRPDNPCGAGFVCQRTSDPATAVCVRPSHGGSCSVGVIGEDGGRSWAWVTMGLIGMAAWRRRILR